MALRQALKDLKEALKHLAAGCLWLTIAILLGALAYHLFYVSKDQPAADKSRILSEAPRVEAAENKEDVESVAPDVVPEPQFTTNDKSVKSNGNILIAARIVNETKANGTLNGSQKVPLQQLMLKPYSYLGKLVSLSGRIYKIEQLPPDRGLPGDWYEILLIGENPNSPLGMTTIDCMYKGDASSLKPKSIMEFSGYFVGTADSPNSVGGRVEAVMLIGNAIQKPGHSKPLQSITPPEPAPPEETSRPQSPANPSGDKSADKPAKISKAQSRRHTKASTSRNPADSSKPSEIQRPTSAQIIERLKNNNHKPPDNHDPF
jgi:hypothetical protein